MNTLNWYFFKVYGYNYKNNKKTKVLSEIFQKKKKEKKKKRKEMCVYIYIYITN